MIYIVISSNSQGFQQNAVVLKNILNKSEKYIYIKFYCQSFLPESFEQGRLKVEFIPAKEERKGRYPGHVGSAVFDRLQVITDAREWDRCLVMDHDMLALCDLAPYFEEDFEGNLLMGRLFGPGNTLGLQMQQRGGLPKPLRHAENYPFYYMGPMMNLAAMRKEGTWKKLLAAHKTLQQDEQMALSVATEGRVKGVSRKWNLVPQWDRLEEGPSGPEKSAFGTAGEAALWRNGLPEGIIHWTGPSKPWHPGTRVWRPDLWESEETSWEALRRGWWEKPLAVLVQPRGWRQINGLARRGWKVVAITPQEALADDAGDAKSNAPKETKGTRDTRSGVAERDGWKPLDDSVYRPFPDLEVVRSVEPSALSSWLPLARLRTRFSENDGWLARAEMVRFGSGADVFRWLPLDETNAAGPWPEYLVLEGPVSAKTWAALKKKGYTQSILLRRDAWPAGGPAPSALDYEAGARPKAAAAPEDLYLRRMAAEPGTPATATPVK